MQTLITEKEFSLKYPISLLEQVTEFLTSPIIEGRFQSGQRLVENKLHRIPVISRKGTFVRKITRNDVEENFPVRAYLEGLAAPMAISHLREDIKEMESALARMREVAWRIVLPVYGIK